MVRPDGSYRLSILKSACGDPSCCQRFFYEYDRPIAGQGHFISTYQTDGDPLPSFEGEPRPVAVDTDDCKGFGDRLWESLNADNKVSSSSAGSTWPPVAVRPCSITNTSKRERRWAMDRSALCDFHPLSTGLDQPVLALIQELSATPAHPPAACERDAFLALLCGLPALRKTPGLPGMDVLGPDYFTTLPRCAGEADAALTRQHLEQVFGITDRDSLIQFCSQELRVQNNWSDFLSFGRDIPSSASTSSSMGRGTSSRWRGTSPPSSMSWWGPVAFGLGHQRVPGPPPRRLCLQHPGPGRL